MAQAVQKVLKAPKVSYNSIRPSSIAKPRLTPPPAPENEYSEAPTGVFSPGQHIWIYRQVRTNQVVYSLTRTLDNSALGQLPFLGKNTQPATIRKDLWEPFVTVSFPNPHQGLSAFQKLREFRKRHEHEWNLKDFPGMTRLQRGRALCDQKANSVADLAAVLLLQHQQALVEAEAEAKLRGENKEAERLAQVRIKALLADQRMAAVEAKELKKEEGKVAAAAKLKELKLAKMRYKRAIKKPVVAKALNNEYDIRNDDGVPSKRGLGREKGKQNVPRFTLAGLKIRWANIHDAEFARTWPAEVMHDVMNGPDGATTRHVAPSLGPPRVARVEMAPRSNELEPRLGHGVERTVSEPVESVETQAEPSRLARLVERLQFGRGKQPVKGSET